MKWHDIQGWFTWPQIYDRMAREAQPGDTIIELGVWRGRSLAYLAHKLTGKGVRLIGVDRFDCSGENTAYHQELSKSIQKGDRRPIFQQCRENLNACGFDWVQLLKSDSITAAQLFPDRSVRFLFIDDFHDPVHIEKEIRAWIPKLRRPTWIAGDDWSLVIAGVKAVFPEISLDLSCWIANVK